MSAWRPAVRMARRDLRRHPVRALLTAVLVMLPVFIGSVATQVAGNDRWTPERDAFSQLLNADASLVTSKWTALRPGSVLRNPRPTDTATKRQDPATVDIASLLPAGSRTATRWYDEVTLSTGGSASVQRVDLANPLTRRAARITTGRAPTAADEVAIPAGAADELGLLEGGKLADGSTFDLLDGVTLNVVGLVDDPNGDQLTLVVPPDSVIPTNQHGLAASLVDLPSMTRAETKALVTQLAAAGVILSPRDAILHPRAWGLGYDAGTSFDPTPYVVGALCVLLGLIEVVFLVGAAFSVAARRQVRDLGLLASNGGAARDVRRSMLAQGLVLGVISSVIGGVLGVLAFTLFAPNVADAVGQPLWRYNTFVAPVILVVLLGATTSVVAALLPAWRLGRLTPVQALSGRFPVRASELRAHRPAFALAGFGFAALLLGGLALAYTTRKADQWTGVAAFLSGIGLVAAVAGVAWCTPYVVRRAAALGNVLPLSGRYALRDAGRQRFRSAAAVLGLTVTVLGSVLAAFAFASQAVSANNGLAPRVATVDLYGATEAQGSAAQDTVDRVLHPLTTATTYALNASTETSGSVTIGRVGDSVTAVDESSLKQLVTVDDDALEVFRAGGVLTTYSGVVRDDQMRLVLRDERGRKVSTSDVAGARVSALPGVTPWTMPSYVSIDTAHALGLELGSPSLIVHTPEPVTRGQIQQLQIYGFFVSSTDPDRALLSTLRFAGLGAAGLLTLLVVGIAVALAAAESKDDVATLVAVGAGPWRRRGFGAMHGAFLAAIGSALGLALGLPAGLSFVQLDGLSGAAIPWAALLGTPFVVVAAGWLIGGMVSPSRLTLTRRLG